MKVKELKKMIKSMPNECEICFSIDEEGNALHKQAFIDLVEDNVFGLYPYGECLEEKPLTEEEINKVLKELSK